MCPVCKTWLNNCGDVCQSPLLHHLNDAEHENVMLRNDAHVGKTAFECTHCGFSNNLVIGFAAVESNSVAVVLSRQTNEPCNREWKELIGDINFLSFMVKVPGATSKKVQSENRVCLIPTVTITNVTNGVVKNSSDSQDSHVESQTLPSRFSSGAEYAECFGALVKLESDFQKTVSKSMPIQVSITLRWEDQPNGKVRANFIMEYDEAVWKIRLGEKLKLKSIGNGTNWTGFGRVVKLPRNGDEEVGLEMETNVNIPRTCTTEFSVSHVWISTSYDRMVSAVRKIASGNSTDPNFLYEQILGTRAHINVLTDMLEWKNLQLQTISNLPSLSAPQADAVKKAIIQHPLTLIQGSSASGKTVTLLNIVYHLVQQNKGPILVCAPTNTVVDHLARCIHQMKLPVVRLFAETKSSQDSPVDFLSLDNQIKHNLPPEFTKLQRKHDEGKKLSPEEADRLRTLRRQAECDKLSDAEVVCCTCIASGDERLASLKFHAILIDESMQATEPECMIPIALGCERLVLVGDHFQLNPVIKCKEALERGLKQSLFLRLISIGVKPLQFTVQYRMHPKLWHFPSRQYEGVLEDGITAAHRKLPDQVLPWMNSEFPLMFYDVKSSEERTWPVKSYVNRKEASKVVQLVTHLLKRGISPDRIGIITQYIGQKKYLKLCMETEGPLDTQRYRKIEVDMVDAFQGREKDIIIVSCVRSQGTTGVGSLNYFRRFHLILTRAKFALVLVGNALALSKQQMWKNYLDFCQRHGVLVEGELDDLKPSAAKFS